MSLKQILYQILLNVKISELQIINLGCRLDRISQRLEISGKISIPALCKSSVFLFKFSGGIGCKRDTDPLKDFYSFFQELESLEWKTGDFITCSSKFKEFCYNFFGFPTNQYLYVREAYDEIMKSIPFKNKELFLLCGSPSSGKSIFLIHHMKRIIDDYKNVVWYFFFF
jgi:hypothetical protein